MQSVHKALALNPALQAVGMVHTPVVPAVNRPHDPVFNTEALEDCLDTNSSLVLYKSADFILNMNEWVPAMLESKVTQDQSSEMRNKSEVRTGLLRGGGRHRGHTKSKGNVRSSAVLTQAVMRSL